MKFIEKHLILRLIDLAALSITAYLLIYLVLSTGVLDTPLLFLSEVFNSLPPLIAYLSLILAGFSLPLFLQRHNCYSINHTIINDIKHLPVYAAPLFIIVFSLSFHELAELVNTFHALAFCMGVLMCLLDMRRKQASELKDGLSGDESQTFDMKTWLNTESRIKNKNYDFINLSAYATRITALLESTEKSHQIAIRGEFGVGKSSLCKLIEERSAQVNKEYIFSYVDGWGRDHDSNAGQILEIIIEELSLHVDSSSLSSIPENYINALNSSGLTGVSSLSHLLGTNSKINPKKHLEKIENILKAIDKHMIIVLEDFDRGCEQEKTVNSLAALLERLKELERINFIICIKATQKSILEKVCTHIEDITEISYEHTKDIIEKFIDLIESEIGADTIYIKQQYLFIKEVSPLIKTPRTLKQALRRTYSAWRNLKGEINLFDLLHFNILRFCSPEAFILFLNSFNTFKSIENLSRQNSAVLKNKLSDEMEKVISSESDRQAAKILIGTFFTQDMFDVNTASQREAALADYRNNIGGRAGQMQRIKSDRLSDYLSRAVVEAVDKNEVRDQMTLRVLHSETPSEESISILLNADNDIHYKNYMLNFIDWTFASTFWANDLGQQLVETLLFEFHRNSKSNTSLYFEMGASFNFRNKNNNTLIYLTCEGITKTLRLRDAQNTNNAASKIREEIFIRIVRSNISIAVELIQYEFGNDHYDIKFQLYKSLFEIIKDNEVDVFKGVDITDTKLIVNLFSLYLEVFKDSNEVSKEDVREFHKALCQQIGIYRGGLIPMLLFHFEECRNIYNPYFLEDWRSDELEKLIGDFEIDGALEYQYKNELVALLEKWKEYARNDFQFQ